MSQSEIANTLRDIANRLLAIVSDVENLGIDYPPVPASAAKQAEDGCCLICGEKKPNLKRGLCESHYKAIYRLVKDGQANWPQLIASGKALPPGKTGRKQSETTKTIVSGLLPEGSFQQVKKARPAKKRKA